MLLWRLLAILGNRFRDGKCAPVQFCCRWGMVDLFEYHFGNATRSAKNACNHVWATPWFFLSGRLCWRNLYQRSPVNIWKLILLSTLPQNFVSARSIFGILRSLDVDTNSLKWRGFFLESSRKRFVFCDLLFWNVSPMVWMSAVPMLDLISHTNSTASLSVGLVI